MDEAGRAPWAGSAGDPPAATPPGRATPTPRGSSSLLRDGRLPGRAGRRRTAAWPRRRPAGRGAWLRRDVPRGRRRPHLPLGRLRRHREARDFGRVSLVTGATEIGQGSETVLAMIVARRSRAARARDVVNSDTTSSRGTSCAHASRTHVHRPATPPAWPRESFRTRLLAMAASSWRRGRALDRPGGLDLRAGDRVGASPTIAPPRSWRHRARTPRLTAVATVFVRRVPSPGGAIVGEMRRPARPHEDPALRLSSRSPALQLDGGLASSRVRSFSRPGGRRCRR